MNISKIQGSVKKPFEFNYLDTDGNICNSPEWVSVKRLSLRKAAADEFQELFSNIEANREKIAGLIENLVDGWSLTKDDEGTPLEIEKEKILDLDVGLANAISEQVAAVVFPNFQTAKN